MNYDIVLHIDLNDPKRTAFAFNNIFNYLNGLPKDAKAKIVLLANGPAVCFFTKAEDNRALNDRAREAMAAGVTIRLCNNALNAFSVDRSTLLEGCEVVPAGLIELVRLQNDGFSYVKP